jgi:hypothetical protein
MLVLVGLAVMGSANAAWDMHSVLTGGLGTLDLHSTVIFDGSIYTYTYVLTASDVVSPVHHFDVGNPNQLEFADAANTGALYAFDNPVYESWLTSVLWSYGEIEPNYTAAFSYTSVYAPVEGDVSATDTGNRAEGKTYVMSTVPEPTTIGGLGVLLLGMAGAFRRRTQK